MMTPDITGFMFQRQTTLVARPLLCVRCGKPASIRHGKRISITKNTTRCPLITATAAQKSYRPCGINIRAAC